MGLFDGVASPGAWGNGSTADIAAATGWPVVLVLDVSGQAQSAAAVALGFARYRDDVTIAGVILNKVASERHDALVRDGFARIGIEVFGAVKRDTTLTMPERHLGLVQAQEDPVIGGAASDAGRSGRARRRYRGIAGRGASDAALNRTRQHLAITPPGQRIALARDVAFSFVYPHLLQGWRAAGAEIVAFSPLADEPPDPSCDVAWLPGGYPELHAGKLAAAARFARRPAQLRADAAGAWRVRRLYDAWARALSTLRACATRWLDYWDSRPILHSAGCIWATGPRRCWRRFQVTPQDARCAAMNSTMPASWRNPTNRSPKSATPRVRRRRKPAAAAVSVTGSFFHMVDVAEEIRP